MWESDQYSVFADRVEQQGFVAKALSKHEIISNYKSELFYSVGPEVNFKFSLNGRDNELTPGIHHHFKCIVEDGICETPVIKFGQPYKDEREAPENYYLPPGTKLRIRVDLKDVFDSFAKHGNFRAYNGDHIYKDDFQGIFIAGDKKPLTWDFEDLCSHPELELKDRDGTHIFEITLNLNALDTQDGEYASWKLTKDISSFPQFESDFLLSDAIYNMSLEEMLKDIESDGTFRTGEQWPGVWTRDISYSIILSMAILQPEVSKNSLMQKVVNGRIIQDTGTGGAYPVSTDRMIWAVAAWEIFKITGDQDWLKDAYEVIKNSAEDDLLNIVNAETGLIKGESSFLDWREQTYPEWMQPADIFESECLGTNAVHFKAFQVLSDMAKELGKDNFAKKYGIIAQNIKSAVNNRLWMTDKGYYGQYLYGRNYKLLSPKAEALGEALCILFDIADIEKQKVIVRNTPVGDFGIACIFPQIANVKPYHNNGIWPFVQAYWSLATAKSGNEQALEDSICAIYRAVALFLTNKENFVAETGDYDGTVINSDNMLWSLSGSLSIVYRIFFGMSYNRHCLSFSPFVPQIFKGRLTLKNFRYRNATLNIVMEGFGNEIAEITLDNNAISDFSIQADLEGMHDVYIKLANNVFLKDEINKVKNKFSLPTPIVRYSDGALNWPGIHAALKYRVYKNGKALEKITKNYFNVPEKECAQYQVVAIGRDNIESFASKPVLVLPDNSVTIYEMESYASQEPVYHEGFSGDGFIEISKNKNTYIDMEIYIAEKGMYLIDFRYSNGNGPVNTENKCALRTLKNGNAVLGTFIFPQRGFGQWSDWGYSNSICLPFDKGFYNLSLVFEPSNENMNIDINHAFLDFMRLIKIG